MTSEKLQEILRKKGYGISSSVGRGIKSEIGKGTISSQISGEGPFDDVESAAENVILRSVSLQIGYTGKCKVRLRFYRRRLADYSRAISEKASVDAAVYCGLLRGDSEKEIQLIDEGQFKVETEAEERTELVFEYEEVDLDNPFVKKDSFGNAS